MEIGSHPTKKTLAVHIFIQNISFQLNFIHQFEYRRILKISFDLFLAIGELKKDSKSSRHCRERLKEGKIVGIRRGERYSEDEWFG